MDDTHALWISARDNAVWAPHGIASLAATHWLDATERRFDGIPGIWCADDESAVGRELPWEVRLRPEEQTRCGELALRAKGRAGSVALRVLDPAAAARRGIARIERAEFSPSRRVAGGFAPSSRAVVAESVDGHHTETQYHGIVSFVLDGLEFELTVQREGDGSLFAAFADATSGVQSYRFRFLRMDGPDADGRVELDFNRAYLPPCAFSDHYACVFPPPGNRWMVPIAAGELVVR
jgi:uncharacterized protein (DUF1684 family)